MPRSLDGADEFSDGTGRTQAVMTRTTPSPGSVAAGLLFVQLFVPLASR